MYDQTGNSAAHRPSWHLNGMYHHLIEQGELKIPSFSPKWESFCVQPLRIAAPVRHMQRHDQGLVPCILQSPWCPNNEQQELVGPHKPPVRIRVDRRPFGPLSLLSPVVKAADSKAGIRPGSLCFAHLLVALLASSNLAAAAAFWNRRKANYDSLPFVVHPRSARYMKRRGHRRIGHSARGSPPPPKD